MDKTYTVLINLVSIHPHPSPQSIPLAAAFLKAYMLKEEVSIQLMDFFLDGGVTTCATQIAATHPGAVGFSIYVWNRDLCCKIAVELRKLDPAVLLFCGGPEVTADPESILNEGLFDFATIGEGELPFSSVCKVLVHGGKLSDIPGVLHPGFPPLPPPLPITNLDEIPSPYLTGVIDTHVHAGILWQLSRGCSFTCDFCFDSRGVHGVRHFSMERVKSELQHFAATGVTQIFVLDSTFNKDPKRAKQILRMIIDAAPDIHFHFEVRNEFIDREMAQLFSQITCSLQIGLQSSRKEVLRLVGRSFNKADFTAKTGLLNDCGAVFGFDLIYGLPGDSLEGFRQSLNYALSLYPNHLDIFPLAVLPGTKLAISGKDLGLHWLAKPPYIVESSESFSSSDMLKAARLAGACDIFYSRGKAVAWFNAVLAILGMKPSDFLEKFSFWLFETQGHTTQESDFSDEEIGTAQHDFLKQAFNTLKTRKYLPLVLDLQNYHYLYAAVLLAPEPEICAVSQMPANILKTGFRCPESARISYFTYEIDELLACGEPHFTWMYEHLPQTASQAVIYKRDGVIYTESLDSAYISLLEQIRDGADSINVPVTGLTNSEAREFLLFALHEGIIAKKQ